MLNFFLATSVCTVVLFSYGKIFQNYVLHIEKNKTNIAEAGIFGCILLSFISLILNFILPLNKFVGDLIIFISFVYFLKFFSSSKQKIEIILLISAVTLLTLLLLFASNINRPDAGLYHIPYINIIQENKVIIGLANIHQRFGSISIMQYLSGIYNSHFFKTESFNIPLASLFSFYFIYLVKLLFIKKNFYKKENILIILIGVFSFYSFSRYSNYGNDLPSHLFFFLMVISIILIEDFSKIKISDFGKILLFSVYCFLNKVLMLILFIFPAVLFYFLFKNKKFSQIILKPQIVFCFIFLFLWMLKNILVSGCIIYPVHQTCIKSFKFTNIENTKNFAIESEAWSKSVNNNNNNKLTSQSDYIKNFEWFATWKQNHLKIINEKISPLLIFLIIYLILAASLSKIRLRFDNFSKINFLLLFTSVLFCIVWFVKFPLYRYGTPFLGLLLITFFFIIYELISINFNSNILRKINIFILLLSLTAFSLKNINRIIDLNNEKYVNYPWPKIYTLNDSDRNVPKELVSIYDSQNQFLYYYSYDECMYSKSPCSHYLRKNLKIDIKFGYRIYFL